MNNCLYPCHSIQTTLPICEGAPKDSLGGEQKGFLAGLTFLLMFLFQSSPMKRTLRNSGKRLEGAIIYFSECLREREK